MMDRYQIRYFLAVVDHGNFSRAASRCNVAQPTLSIGIAKLERAIGSPLFLRSSQRVELTAAGSNFLLHARRIENDFNQALQSVTGTAGSAVLRVGILRSVPGPLVAAAASRMIANDPDARIEILEGSERELTNSLSRGRLDCAVTLVGRGSERFLEEPILEEGYALALPATHPLADEPVLPAEALADNVMIVRRHCEVLSETSRHFTERGIRPHFAYRATNDDRVLQMVGAGVGVTVMPQSYRHNDVTRPRLAGFAHRRILGLVYGSGSEHLVSEPTPFIVSMRDVLAHQNQPPEVACDP